MKLLASALLLIAGLKAANSRIPQKAKLEDVDILAYTERVAATSLEVTRSAYNDLHERAYKLATLLVAGGGGLGTYALGKFGNKAAPLEWAPLAALALGWFLIAAVLVLRAAISKELSPGNGPKNLRAYFQARLSEHPEQPAVALEKTRNAELDLLQIRIDGYREGCIARALALDSAYRWMVIGSPTVLAIVAILCIWGRYPIL